MGEIKGPTAVSEVRNASVPREQNEDEAVGANNLGLASCSCCCISGKQKI